MPRGRRTAHDGWRGIRLPRREQRACVASLCTDPVPAAVGDAGGGVAVPPTLYSKQRADPTESLMPPTVQQWPFIGQGPGRPPATLTPPLPKSAAMSKSPRLTTVLSTTAFAVACVSICVLYGGTTAPKRRIRKGSSALRVRCPEGRDAFESGEPPPPPPGAQPVPSHCLPDGKCQLQWHLL